MEPEKPHSGNKMFELYRSYSLSAVERGNSWVEMASKRMDVKGKKIVDLGCGEGGVAIAFAKAGAHVTGIDINEKIIRAAKARAREYNVEVDFRVEDGISSSLKNGEYDVVISSDVMEHISDPLSYLKEANRLLKSGGLVLISCTSRFSMRNIITDPHFGLFGISAFPPKIGEYYTVKIRKVSKKFNLCKYFTFNEVCRLLEEAGFDNNIIDDIVENMRSKIQNTGKIGSAGWGKLARIIKRLGLVTILELFVRMFPSVFAPSFTFSTKKTA